MIEFDEAEVLQAWDPDDATVSPDEVRVTSASKVCWEWFYCGRAKTAENRYYIEHVRSNDNIVRRK